jgi:hypothetical protein
MTTTESLILVLDNDRGLYEECMKIVRRARRRSDPENPNVWFQVRDEIRSPKDATKFKSQDGLKDFIENQLELVDTALPNTRPELRHGVRCLVAQVLGHMPTEVDWAEVARHYLAKLEEQEAIQP